MRLILVPQAVRTMLPAIVAQCVVALKDTALGQDEHPALPTPAAAPRRRELPRELDAVGDAELAGQRAQRGQLGAVADHEVAQRRVALASSATRAARRRGACGR